jgi:hypothetical protein
VKKERDKVSRPPVGLQVFRDDAFTFKEGDAEEAENGHAMLLDFRE